jgi:hypothetical protein
LNDKKGKGQGFRKPYNKNKGKKKDVGGGSKPNVSDVRWFKCGTSGHYSSDCKKGEVCFKCGKAGNKLYECKGKDIVCFNIGEAGHVSTKCTKPKKAGGKMFALNAEEVEQPDNLIRGMSFIKSTPLIAFIDTGALILLSRLIMLNV